MLQWSGLVVRRCLLGDPGKVMAATGTDWCLPDAGLSDSGCLSVSASSHTWQRLVNTIFFVQDELLALIECNIFLGRFWLRNK